MLVRDCYIWHVPSSLALTDHPQAAYAAVQSGEPRVWWLSLGFVSNTIKTTSKNVSIRPKGTARRFTWNIMEPEEGVPPNGRCHDKAHSAGIAAAPRWQTTWLLPRSQSTNCAQASNRRALRWKRRLPTCSQMLLPVYVPCTIQRCSDYIVLGTIPKKRRTADFLNCNKPITVSRHSARAGHRRCRKCAMFLPEPPEQSRHTHTHTHTVPA